MYEVHGVRISHQTIMNYSNTVSAIVKGFIDYYPYNLSDKSAANETYINVRGKQHYVFFYSDSIKRIITFYKIYENRDTKCACESMYNTLFKYKGNLPENFPFITDGNPIYAAAKIFFSLNDINFNLIQIVGLTNKDETAKEYRPYKQIEERLNRTYKQNYYGTNGYDCH